LFPTLVSLEDIYLQVLPALLEEDNCRLTGDWLLDFLVGVLVLGPSSCSIILSCSSVFFWPLSCPTSLRSLAESLVPVFFVKSGWRQTPTFSHSSICSKRHGLQNENILKRHLIAHYTDFITELGLFGNIPFTFCLIERLDLDGSREREASSDRVPSDVFEDSRVFMDSSILEVFEGV
jgi:hypothetical protein